MSEILMSVINWLPWVLIVSLICGIWSLDRQGRKLLEALDCCIKTKQEDMENYKKELDELKRKRGKR